MTSTEDMRAIVARYVACVGAGDTEGIVALYAENATVEDPYGTPAHHGHDGIRSFYGALAGTEMSTELLTARVAGDSAAFQLRVLTKADGKTITISPIDVMTFNGDGKISTMRAYWGGEDLTVT